MRPSIILVVAALGLGATRADAETISGVVSRYSYAPAIGPNPGGPEVGLASKLVTLETWVKEEVGPCTPNCIPLDGSCRRCGYSCVWQRKATATTMSAADGSYSITYAKPSGTAQVCGSTSPVPITTARVTVRAAGHETLNYSYTGPISSSTGFTATWNLQHAAELASPLGMLFARRIGTGSIPVIIVEPWDPGDGIKSSLEACPKNGNGQPMSGCIGMAEFLAASKLHTTNLLSYLLTHDYTVWMLLHGPKGGETIMGTAASGNTNGLAYETAYLTKQIRDTYHPSKEMVVGGYSMGGLLVQTGLAHWCAGNWVTASGGLLDAGCSSVALWFAGDSPLEGAHVPIAVMRYAKALAGDYGDLLVSKLANAPASREMLTQWVTDGCDVNCVDLGGCTSTEGDFRDGCSLDNSVRDQFTTWQNSANPSAGASLKAMPLRSGTPIPAFAFSVGTLGTNNCGGDLVHTEVSFAGDHHILANTAGSVNDCVPGSQLDSLTALHGKGATFWHVLSVEVHIHALATFIATASALKWDSHWSLWKNYWHETRTTGDATQKLWPSPNHQHKAPLPSGAAKSLMAYISEYTHGGKNVPVCNHPDKILGLDDRVTCRLTWPEWLGTTGVDDDGDDLIDEHLTCADRINAPCQCGDGFCEAGEDVSNCCQDCGPDNCKERTLAGSQASTLNMAHGIAFGTNDAMYMTGVFDGTMDLGNRSVPGDTWPITSGAVDVGFIAKYESTNGRILWARKLPYAIGVTTDSSGAAILIGFFNGTMCLPDTSNLTRCMTSFGGRDVYVVKFSASDPLGRIEWMRQIGGGTSYDTPARVGTHQSGGIYVYGEYGSTNPKVSSCTGPVCTSAQTVALPVTGSLEDLFLVEFSTGGGVVFAKGWGGAASDRARGMAVKYNGPYVYISAKTAGTVNFGGGNVAAGAVMASYGSSDGSYRWAYQRGTGNIADLAISPGVTNWLYAIGDHTSSTDDLGCGPLPRVGAQDAFFAKFGSSGNCVWAQNLGVPGTAQFGRGVAVDMASEPTFTFEYSGQIGPFLGTYLNATGQQDVAIVKYSTTESLKSWWSIGGAYQDYVTDIAIDRSGYATVAGSYERQANIDGDVTTPPTMIRELYVRKNGPLQVAQTITGAPLAVRAANYPEICDGLDNDGDGVVDDGFFIGQSCSIGVGACQTTGVFACTATGESTCDAIQIEPTDEACGTGIDENCDGLTDECPCIAAEDCNSLDDDCDGNIDEDLTNAECVFTNGSCQVLGTQSCTLSGWSSCVPPAEVCCDNIDNDCDLATDEGCHCGGGGGGGGCFVAGTQILMGDGTTKSIELMVIGDVVMAYDVTTGALVPKRVEAFYVHDDLPSDVLINGSIRTTRSHPFFANGVWMRADELQLGDTLFQFGGESIGVQSLATTGGIERIYNLKVEGLHTYFANGVLVHNGFQEDGGMVVKL